MGFHSRRQLIEKIHFNNGGNGCKPFLTNFRLDPWLMRTIWCLYWKWCSLIKLHDLITCAIILDYYAVFSLLHLALGKFLVHGVVTNSNELNAPLYWAGVVRRGGFLRISRDEETGLCSWRYAELRSLHVQSATLSVTIFASTWLDAARLCKIKLPKNDYILKHIEEFLSLISDL